MAVPLAAYCNGINTISPRFARNMAGRKAVPLKSLSSLLRRLANSPKPCVGRQGCMKSERNHMMSPWKKNLPNVLSYLLGKP